MLGILSRIGHAHRLFVLCMRHTLRYRVSRLHNAGLVVARFQFGKRIQFFHRILNNPTRSIVFGKPVKIYRFTVVAFRRISDALYGTYSVAFIVFDLIRAALRQFCAFECYAAFAIRLLDANICIIALDRKLCAELLSFLRGAPAVLPCFRDRKVNKSNSAVLNGVKRIIIILPIQTADNFPSVILHRHRNFIAVHYLILKVIIPGCDRRVSVYAEIAAVYLAFSYTNLFNIVGPILLLFCVEKVVSVPCRLILVG